MLGGQPRINIAINNYNFIMKQFRSSHQFRNYPFNSVVGEDLTLKTTRSALHFRPKPPRLLKKAVITPSNKYQSICFSDSLNLNIQIQQNLLQIATEDAKHELVLTMVLKLINEIPLSPSQIQIFNHRISNNFYVYISNQKLYQQSPISTCCEAAIQIVFSTSSQQTYIFCIKCSQELFSERRRPKSRAKSSNPVGTPLLQRRFQNSIEFEDQLQFQFRMSQPRRPLTSQKVSSLIQSGKYKRKKLLTMCTGPIQNENFSDPDEDLRLIVDKL